MEDEKIIDLYFSRNEQAIRETEKKYGRYCHTVSMNVLHNREDAEECVNDTWLRTWQSIPPQRPTVLRLFLAAITRRLSIDKWNRNHTAKRNGGAGDVVEELADVAEIPDGRAQELPALFDEFLHSLDATERKIFVQRYWYSLSPDDIGREVGLSRGAVWTRLSRTREKLRAFLEQRGFTV